jgi:gliding motility-associated-like protein
MLTLFLIPLFTRADNFPAEMSLSNEASAGKDTVICGSELTLYANHPADPASGRWVIPSGLRISSESNPEATVYGFLPDQTYTLQWIVTGEGESIFTDEVNITCRGLSDLTEVTDRCIFSSDNKLYISFAQPPLNFKSYEKIDWSVVSSQSVKQDSISGMNSPDPIFSGLTYGTHVFAVKLTDSASGCSYSKQFNLVVSPLSTTSQPSCLITVAGSDTAVSLKAANSKSTVSVFSWKKSSSDLSVITFPASPETQITNLSPGIHSFIYSVQTGACIDSTNISIPVISRPELGQDISGTSSGLENIHVTGWNPAQNSIWTASDKSIIFSSPGGADTRVSDVPPGSHIIYNTFSLGSNCIATDSVRVTRLTRPAAGPDQCNIISPLFTGFTISGNKPSPTELSYWLSDDTLAGTDTTIHLPPIPGKHRFRYVIENRTTGDTISDWVTVINLTKAVTGPDICSTLDSVRISGSIPLYEAGEISYWKSHMNLIRDTINTNIRISKIPGGVHWVKWYIRNEFCMDSATMRISKITRPDAGRDQLCLIPSEAKSVQLSANPFNSLYEKGLWTTNSSETVAIKNPEAFNSLAEVNGYGIRKFIWTIKDTLLNPICTASDTMMVSVISNPETASDLCLTLPEATRSVILTGSSINPATESSRWLNPEGLIISDKQTATVTPGTGEFRYIYEIVQNQTGCSRRKTQNITVISKADAGDDICTTYPASTVKITATPPASGESGKWSVTTVNLQEDRKSSTELISPGGGVHTLKWIIERNGCKDSSSLRVALISPADIQSRSCISALQPADINLSANPISNIFDKGKWTVSPTSVNPNPDFSDAGSNSVKVSGLQAGLNRFYWTVKDTLNIGSFCSFKDSLDLTVISPSEAGTDQCNIINTSSGTFTLTGSRINQDHEECTWISKEGIQITNPTKSTAKVTLRPGIFTFYYTIRNNDNQCESRDSVVYRVSSKTSVSEPRRCLQGYSNKVQLIASKLQAPETGIWENLNPAGSVVQSSNNDTAEVSHLGYGIHRFRWTAGVEGCKDSSFATVSVVKKAEANEGDGICLPNNKKSAVMTGNGGESPLHNGFWYSQPGTLSSGNAKIDKPYDDTTRVSGLLTGVNYFIWKLSLKADSTCYSTDTLKITLTTKPYAGNDLCITLNSTGYSQVNLGANKGDTLIEKFIWSSNNPTLSFPKNGVNPIFFIPRGKHEFYWTITNKETNCSQTDTMIVRTVSPATTEPIACLTLDKEYGNLKASGYSSATEQGMWTNETRTSEIIIEKPNLPESRILNLHSGVHTFKWVINFETCRDSTYHTVSVLTLPEAGTDKCLTSENGKARINLEGNFNRKFENAAWKPQITSLNNIVIDSVNSPNSGLTIYKPGNYKFYWTIADTSRKPICSLNDSVQITLITKAGAGPDSCVSIAGKSDLRQLGLKGRVPDEKEITQWSSPIPDLIASQNRQSATSKLLNQGKYNFIYRISNSEHPSCFSADTVVYRVITRAEATGPGCIFTATGSVNTFVNTAKLNDQSPEKGMWSNFTGLQLIEPTREQLVLMNVPVGIHPLIFTSGIDNCLTKDTVIVKVATQAVTPESLIVCGKSDSIFASPFNPAFEQGEWISSESSVIVTKPQLAKSYATGLFQGENLLIWKVSLDECSSTDSLTVHNLQPERAIIRKDVTTTCLSVINLEGNNPLFENDSCSCVWKIIDQPLNNHPKVLFFDDVKKETIAQANTYKAKAIQTTALGNYTFIYQIFNKYCSPVSDTIVISKEDLKGEILSKDILCISDTLNLSAKIPPGNIDVTWICEKVDDFKFTSTKAVNTKLYDIKPSSGNTMSITLQLKEGNCITTPTKKIILAVPPSTADIISIPDTLCENDTIELSAVDPVIGKGQWTSSGKAEFTHPDSSNTKVILKEYGNFDFTWTTSNSPCSNSIHTVPFVRYKAPETADAGDDSIIVCGSRTTLKARPISVGSGKWSFSAGSATLSSTKSPVTEIYNLRADSTYTLIWSVKNGTCSSSDSVNILAKEQAIHAIAEEDTILICEAGNVQLHANTPNKGNGKWIASRNGIWFKDSLSPETSAHGIPEGHTLFIWTIDNNYCTSSDSVLVIRDISPDIPDAGFDMLIHTPEVKMDAHRPQRGKGLWTTTESNIRIHDRNSPTSIISGIPLGESFLIWTIRNGICPAKSDTVKITRENFHIHNAFSPNGDTKNKVFTIDGIKEFEPVEFTVMNRWGQTVYYRSNYQNDWDGTSDTGKILSDDTYYYILRLGNNEMRQGYIILKR